MTQLTENVGGGSPTDPEAQMEGGQERNPERQIADAPMVPVETIPAPSNWNKPLSFYLAFLSLLIMVLLVSLDATALAVAIPVSQTSTIYIPVLAFF